MTSTRWRTLGPWMALTAVWVAAIVTAAILFPLSQGLERAGVTPASPTTQTIGSRTTSLKTPVTVTATLRPAFQVLSAAAGTVTAVHISAGASVKNGAALWDVDGVPVVAYVAATPLWRDLTLGDRGTDVAAVARFLRGAGYLRVSTSPPRSTTALFDARIKHGVVALQARLGVTQDGVFRQRYVAFVPKDARPVSRTLVRVGDLVSPQSAVLALRSDVDALRIAPAEGGSTVPFEGRAAVLTSGDRTVRLKRFPAGRDEYDAILALGEQSPSSPVDPAATSVTLQGMQLSLAAPLQVATVPSSAVFVAPDGTSCVFVPRARSAPKPQIVHLQSIQSTELGVVYLDRALAGTTVVGNPYGSLRKEELRCR